MTRPKPESQRAGRPSTAPRTLTGGLSPDLEAPASLGEVGASVWRRVLGLGLPYAEGDLYALERYCQLHDRRDALLEAVAKEGVMVPGSKRQPVVNPAMRALDPLESQMARLEAVLLLTPEARARFGITVEDKDELEDWLNEGDYEPR